MKHRSLFGVEVLGLCVGKNAATKRNGTSLLVVYGKHHAIVKAVRQVTVALHGEVGSLHFGLRKAFGLKVINQHGASRCVAKVPAPTNLGAKTTTRQIAPSLRGAFSASSIEDGGVVGLRLRKAFHQPVAARPPTPSALFHKLDARAIGKVAY